MRHILNFFLNEVYLVNLFVDGAGGGSKQTVAGSGFSPFVA